MILLGKPAPYPITYPIWFWLILIFIFNRDWNHYNHFVSGYLNSLIPNPTLFVTSRLTTKWYEIKGYFATEIDCSQTRISGRFFGKDCLFQQKVVLLDQYLLENKIEYSESIVYSDSSSDLPLLKWANTAFVVSKDKICVRECASTF